MNFNDSVSQDSGRGMSAIIPINPAYDNKNILMPADPNKDVQYRMGMFIEWLNQRGQRWFEADLAAYRDYLLQPHEILIKLRICKDDSSEQIAVKKSCKDYKLVPAKSEATVAAHLATIRGRYNALLKSNNVRQDFYDMAPSNASAADRKAFVDEVLVRLQNAVHPSTAAVKQTKKQDEADNEHLRLKRYEAEMLMSKPGIDTMTGIRDTAIIALVLSTGIREAELTALDVDDLRQTYDGELALRVRHGKGNKQRMIVYGPLVDCLGYVDRWMLEAGITEEVATHAARAAALPEHQHRALEFIEKKPCSSRMLMSAFKWSESDTDEVLNALIDARLIDQDKGIYSKKSHPVFRGFYRGGNKVRPNRLTTRSINEIMNGYPIMIGGKSRAVKPHDLRRSYARLFFEMEKNVLIIQQNLGHESLETTQIYIGALGGEMRRPPAMFTFPHDPASIKKSIIT